MRRNGEVNDDEYGTIPSLSLNPAKARVLLTLCLMKGKVKEKFFVTFGVLVRIRCVKRITNS